MVYCPPIERKTNRKLTCQVMSTDDRVKMISTGRLSPGSSSDAVGRYLPFTDDFTFFFGQRFTCTRADLAVVSVAFFRCREAAAAAVAHSLELLDVPLTAVLEHVALLPPADTSLLSLHRSPLSDDSLEQTWTLAAHKIHSNYKEWTN